LEEGVSRERVGQIGERAGRISDLDSVGLKQADPIPQHIEHFRKFSRFATRFAMDFV